MTHLAFDHRLDQWLIRKGDRQGWLLAALRLVTARRIAAAPVARLGNRRLARRIVSGSQWATYIPRNEGYRAFSPDTFAELPRVAEAGQAVYDRYMAALTGSEIFNKSFFYNILTADGLREHPIFLDFALSTAVTEAVTGYLGQLPRLNSIGVFHSPINDTVDGSQMYHVDGDALTQVKCFVNIWNVGAGGGAFTFIPKAQMSRSLRQSGLLKTLSDDDVFRVVPEERQVALEGPPGSGAFVDTSRCLHQGSRTRTSPRLVLKIQYVARPDALLPRTSGRAAHGGHHMITRQLLESVDLHNANAKMFVD